MDNKIEKLKEIFQDEALAKEVLSIDKPEDAQEWFDEHGVQLSLDEIKDMGGLCKKIASGEITEDTLQKASKGELTPEELETVAGGNDTDDFLFGLVNILIDAVPCVITIGVAFGW